jgi:hypothetical protein
MKGTVMPRNAWLWVYAVLIAGTASGLTACTEPPKKVATPAPTPTNPLINKPLACGLFPSEAIAKIAELPLSSLGEDFPRAARTDKQGKTLWDDIPGSCRVFYLGKDPKQRYIAVEVRYDFLAAKGEPEFPGAAGSYQSIYEDADRVKLPASIGDGYFASYSGAHFTLPCGDKGGLVYAQLEVGYTRGKRELPQVLPFIKTLSNALKTHPDCRQK